MVETWRGLTICRLDPYDFTVDADMNAMYLESMEAHHPRYFATQRPLVHPGLLLNRSNDTRSPSYEIPTNEAGIHAKDDVQFVNVAKVGDTFRTTWEYVDRYERRGRPYLVIEATITSDDGSPILRRKLYRTITTDTKPIAAKDEETASQAPAVGQVTSNESSAANSEVGIRVYGRSKTMTLERLRIFSGPKKNIHTDEEAAHRAGLRAPIASATQSMGHVCELMIDYFGEGWLSGGTLKATFVRPIFVGDVLSYEGHIANKGSEGDHVTYVVQLTGLNQKAQPVTLATATA